MTFQSSISKVVGVALFALASLPAVAHSSDSLESVTFGLNWSPQAEHGGFYQALAEELYERRQNNSWWAASEQSSVVDHGKTGFLHGRQSDPTFQRRSI